jgi:predicted transcriptional regulator
MHHELSRSISAVEQIEEILAALAVNKSQLASLMRVSRPTLYDWLRGQEPATANAERLDLFSELLSKADVCSTAPLNARFVKRPVEPNGLTLLEVLSAETIDRKKAEAFLRAAKAFTHEATKCRTTREERLRGLGYDEPTDEERSHRLNQNIAGMDWPTE